MSRKKGLSVEEKRSRMMNFFYEKKDFFTLKELERMCQKEKGITSMSVKDILTSLVDDAMVDTDKIGTSVYFWAFPSKASQNRKRKINDVTNQLEEFESKKKALTESVLRAKVGKEDNDDRSELLAELVVKKDEKSRLMSELDLYRECDPDVLQEVQNQTVVAKEAANRWTDNVFSIKSWIKRKFSFEESVIDKQFDIPEDFDYVE
ncbi:meiotic nuclear division protein 1 homolog isoform X1 [Mizuhopecten yessoensis]|uniref:meiotic nuclear division protein 1 homolog isoform X1 n=2 Tax=Mizuhopecten yessoensis TaxID=6573 RepID=UPI000B45D431|nr:meiotic nuclear division protein 1 homolog isoform X1 [Mizuhopecten yessoensis]